MTTVNGNGITATIQSDPTGRVQITGRVLAVEPQSMKIEWRAAAPATRGIGFAGSAQPYPNRHIAFDHTPNIGETTSRDGSFTIELSGMPAGYYTGLGAMYVPPVVEFYVTPDYSKQTFKLLLAIATVAAPYRWTGGAPPTLLPTPNTAESTGRAMFYAGNSIGHGPIFPTQEAALRARAYPAAESHEATPWATIPAP